MACPLQAHFKYDLDLPGKTGSKATFGNCIHAALEHYNRTGDLPMAEKLFTEAWENPAVIGRPEIDVWNKFTNYGGLRQKGLDILRAYEARMRIEERVVIAAEHEFLVPFGDHELSGICDLVSVRKNHRGRELLAIEDYKTAARKPTVAGLRLDQQFTVYIYALSQPEFWLGNPIEPERYRPVPNGDWWMQTLADLPRRGIWVHLWDENCKELDAGDRDDEDFARLYRLCNEIERAIEHEVFVPQIGDACELCDFAHDPCPQDPPSRAYWEADRIEADPNAWV